VTWLVINGRNDRDLTPCAMADVVLTIRGHKVILDRDLAMLYGVEVKRLNEQMKSSRDRFPDDLRFSLHCKRLRT